MTCSGALSGYHHARGVRQRWAYRPRARAVRRNADGERRLLDFHGLCLSGTAGMAMMQGYRKQWDAQGSQRDVLTNAMAESNVVAWNVGIIH